MKKFISMVMAAAMVVSLVPATAFAATGYVSADKAKVVGALEEVEDFAYGKGNSLAAADMVTGFVNRANAPEVQITLDDVDNNKTTTPYIEQDITVTLDGAEFTNNNGQQSVSSVSKSLLMGFAINGTEAATSASDLTDNLDGTWSATAIPGITVTVEVNDDYDEATFTVLETTADTLASDDVISIDLVSIMGDTDAGEVATVTVESDIVGAELDAVAYIEVLEEGITVTLKKVATVAEEETTPLETKMEIEANVGTFYNGQVLELELNSGFEWVDLAAYPAAVTGATIDRHVDDEDVLVVTVVGTPTKIVIPANAVAIDAVNAEVGDVATIKVDVDKAPGGAGFEAKAEAVEAAKVVGEEMTMTLDDEDEDLPVIYSGVNVDNYGLTDDSTHESLKVHFEESVAAALDEKKAFTLTLPEGVFVTNVTVTGEKDVDLVNFADTNAGLQNAFAAAYKKGEQETFEFARKTFADSVNPFEFDVVFELIAVPGFVGDVTLTLDGAGFESAQEVTIATFVAPYTVEAQANDLIIDYRNTEVPTDIVITEAEAGLWSTDMTFEFALEKDDLMEFEGEPTITVNEDESEMELTGVKDMKFSVKTKSDDEPAVVTISDIELYMNRSIAAGAYDLEMGTSAAVAMMTGLEADGTDASAYAALFTTETGETDVDGDGTNEYYVADFADWDVVSGNFVPEKATVKEGFVNVITAGRDQDDASFTKKVVVPVGESYIIAGEETVALDVPAYINANGYTMLPVRAVATALGINNNNVIWSQSAKQVTILYGQRIITMTVGQAVVYVNGSAIPATAAVEVVDGRAFLGMRDLANALGVTNISWDAATQTATLN